MSAQFPSVVAAAAQLPDSVLDGELVAVQGRNAVSSFVMVASDLLESAGNDWRGRPLHERRGKLHEIVYSVVLGVDERPAIQLTDIIRAPSWPTLAIARDQARQDDTGGLILKGRESAYGELGNPTLGDNVWWVW